MTTKTTSTKLSKQMLAILDEAVKQPVREYGNANQLKALAKRGLMSKQYDGKWILTNAGIELLGIDKNAVALRYAEYNLRQGGFQIRHNVLMVDYARFGGGEISLRHEYYKRSFQQEVDAVADWQQRAIELARAEIRAGIAR